MDMDDVVIFPSTRETLNTISAMLQKSDPPIVTKEYLVQKSVALLKGIFDAVRGEHKELVISEPNSRREYWPVAFPFWLDWEWEPAGGDAAWDEAHFLGLMLSPGTRMRAKYLMTFAPKLECEGHVISAGLKLFKDFQDCRENRRHFGVVDYANGNQVSPIQFPFWQAEA